jgi:DNA-binding XRE family transcriptional regulator
VDFVHYAAMHISQWMSKEVRTDDWLADRVGRERSTITKLRLGQAEPSMELARRIEAVTRGKVTLYDWPKVPDRYKRRAAS